jgi:type I restriction enzyme, S subunit
VTCETLSDVTGLVRPVRPWPTYPAYKPSGVEWLGDIPAHWLVDKLKHKASVAFSSVDKHSNDGELSVQLCNYVDVYKNDYITERLEFMKATASPDEVARFTLQQGDVLITKDSESWDDIAIPAYVISKMSGVLCGYHLALVRPKLVEIDGRFLFRAFQAKAVNYQFEVAANGITRFGIGKSSIDSAIFPIPPLPEQRTIAAFLDHETAKLDALIAKHERLIELLREKRAALISHAVTQGLDPSAPMKDSDVPWLGQIPAHWEVMRIGTLSQSLQTGPFGSQLHAEDYVPGGIPVINPSHLKGGRIYPDSDIAIDQETWNRLSQHELREGDIVFARRGELGRCAMVTSQEASWLCGTGSLRMRPNIDVAHPPFLNHVLATRGIAETLLLESVGSTMDNLNTKILSRLSLPVPPVEEQKAITSYLDRETAKFDALMARVRQGVEKLREYRAALISAAVTGNVDLRGFRRTEGSHDLEGLER